MGFPKPNLRGLLEPKGLGPLAQWLEQSLVGWVNSIFNPDNSIKPAHLSDAAAITDSIYYSTTTNLLSYKDPAGVIHHL